MRGQTLTPSAPLIQGVTAPNIVVNPDAFYAATRRMKFTMRSMTDIAGLGSTDSVQLRQSGIVAGLFVRVKGTITFGGTIGTTTMSYEWPFNVAQEFRLSANGQSNLLKCRGLTLRAHEFITNPKISDEGLSKTFGGTVYTSGTLAMSCDDWGTSGVNVLAPGSNVAAIGTYTVDLVYFLPVAADQVSLIGAVFAQSQATNLALEAQWATQNQIVSALGGAATFASDLQWQVLGLVYSIPNVGGQFVVPDLSVFHQIAEASTGGLSAGGNEYNLPGTGVGRQLMRVLFNTYSSSTPLALTDTNYSATGWAYGGSDTPEQYPNGGDLRADNLRTSGVDLGQLWGLGLFDFASMFALRDVVDEATTSDLRITPGLVAAPTNGKLYVAQETLFAAPVGA